MSEIQGESKIVAFDGWMQLNGEAAPDLEVVVELDGRFVVLDHSSGELGRWERATVTVAPAGRGWFTLQIDDEEVTFLPRRPGIFAAATVDMVPVEETKRRFRRKARTRKKDPKPKVRKREARRREKPDRTSEAQVPDPSDATTATPAVPEAVPEPVPVVEPEVIAPQVLEPVEHVEPDPIAPPVRAPASEPSSPWDDVPVPEVPTRKQSPTRPAERKRRRSSRDKPPKPSRAEGAAPAGASFPTKEKRRDRKKEPKPSSTAQPVPSPAGPKQKGAFARLFTGFWHGFKAVALRVSDELRQTGIVPFDRLPAAPARLRPAEDHEHDFQVHRLPGGLSRNVCHECGLVSIGESPRDG